MKKRVLSLLLCLCLMVSLMPMAETSAEATTYSVVDTVGSNSTNLAQAMIDLGLSQKGKTRSEFDSDGMPTGDWCAYFMIYLSRHSGVGAAGILPNAYSGYGTTRTLAEFTLDRNMGMLMCFQDTGYNHMLKYTSAANLTRCKLRDYEPKPGDLIFFRPSSSTAKFASHVGLVYKVTSSKVYYVHGNYSSSNNSTWKTNYVDTASIGKYNTEWIAAYLSPNYGGGVPSTPGVSSTVECKYEVLVPANYKLQCYQTPESTAKYKIIAASATPYTLYCTKQITLSNGNTRYYFVSGDGYELYFDFINTMTVEIVHNYTYTDISPTCTEQGYTHRRCTCGAEDTVNYMSPVGHRWINATVTTPKTCSVCGVTEGEPLSCVHFWKIATCTEPSVCTKCGVTDGFPLNHSWEVATCTAPATCEWCGATEGAALGHIWVDATENAPKTCSVCGETQGDPLPHIHVFDKNIAEDAYKATDATCAAKATYYKSCACGEKGTETFESGERLDHTWTDATCTAPKTCSVCNITEGETLPHSWADATETTPKTCATCGVTEGDPLPHIHAFDKNIAEDAYKATDATCTAKATYYESCACGEKGAETFESGERLDHTWTDATYTEPKTCSVCGATEGEPLPEPTEPESAETLDYLNLVDPLELSWFPVSDLKTGYARNYANQIPEGGAQVLIFYSSGCYNSRLLLSSLNKCQWLDNPYVKISAVDIIYQDTTQIRACIDELAPKTWDHIDYAYNDMCNLAYTYRRLYTGSSMITMPQVLVLTMDGEDRMIRYAQCEVLDAELIYNSLLEASPVFAAYEAGGDPNIEAPHVHSVKSVIEVGPTCEEDGRKFHYVCSCGKLFWDYEATQEITDSSALVTPALDHSYSDDTDATCNTCGEVREVMPQPTEPEESTGDDPGKAPELKRVLVSPEEVEYPGSVDVFVSAEHSYFDVQSIKLKFVCQETGASMEVDVTDCGHDDLYGSVTVEASTAPGTYVLDWMKLEGGPGVSWEFYRENAPDDYAVFTLPEEWQNVKFTVKGQQTSVTVWGDADDNGRVNAKDAMLTLQYYTKKITEEKLNTITTDVDGNGKHNAKDAMLILQYYTKKLDTFPVEDKENPTEPPVDNPTEPPVEDPTEPPVEDPGLIQSVTAADYYKYLNEVYLQEYPLASTETLKLKLKVKVRTTEPLQEAGGTGLVSTMLEDFDGDGSLEMLTAEIQIIEAKDTFYKDTVFGKDGPYKTGQPMIALVLRHFICKDGKIQQKASDEVIALPQNAWGRILLGVEKVGQEYFAFADVTGEDMSTYLDSHFTVSKIGGESLHPVYSSAYNGGAADASNYQELLGIYNSIDINAYSLSDLSIHNYQNPISTLQKDLGTRLLCALDLTYEDWGSVNMEAIIRDYTNLRTNLEDNGANWKPIVLPEGYRKELPTEEATLKGFVDRIEEASGVEFTTYEEGDGQQPHILYGVYTTKMGNRLQINWNEGEKRIEFLSLSCYKEIPDQEWYALKDAILQQPEWNMSAEHQQKFSGKVKNWVDYMSGFDCGDYTIRIFAVKQAVMTLSYNLAV